MNGIPCEEIGTHADFRHLSTLGHGIRVDLRYGTADNFVGHDVYGALDCAWLRVEAAAALENAAAWLATQRPGYTLLVLDALRPQRIQQRLWDELQGTPLTMYLANPERGSIHSFGMAVDLTVLDPHFREVDMGTGFDEMVLASHPEYDSEHLAQGVLTAAQVAERGWLRAAMRQAGFHGISTEWWHYDFGDRVSVRHDLPRVL